jgi:hypothetical protein
VENDFAQSQLPIAIEELPNHIGFDLLFIAHGNQSSAEHLLKPKPVALDNPASPKESYQFTSE